METSNLTLFVFVNLMDLIVSMPLLSIILAYVIGSIPFGYLAGKINGVDLREHGSKNIGATNAVRVLGKKWGIPVFICDFLKGFLPLLMVKWAMGGDLGELSSAQLLQFLGVMLALILGHTYACFLRFRGGKGVATTAGCLFAVSPLMGGIAVAVWVLCMVLTRYVSLSSMVAGLAMVVVSCVEFVGSEPEPSGQAWIIPGAIFFIFVLVVYKHRANIGRLLNGTEPKAFSKKSH